MAYTKKDGKTAYERRQDPRLKGEPKKDRDSFTYEILHRYAVLGTCFNGERIEVNKVSFNGNPARLDIRRWRPEEPDPRDRCRKGISMTDEQGRMLYETLKGIYG